MNKKILFFCLMIVTLLMVNNCKKVTTDSPLVLSAVLMVNGLEVTNSSVSNLSQGDLMTVRAQFSDLQGNHTIKTAVASFSHGMGMMKHVGEFHLWDNGTHGDEFYGDGWFSMEDEMSEMMSIMGIGWGQMMGTYEFEFYCIDEDGNESNHISVHLDIN